MKTLLEGPRWHGCQVTPRCDRPQAKEKLERKPKTPKGLCIHGARNDRDIRRLPGGLSARLEKRDVLGVAR